jgi:hypothetical protein
MSLTEGAKVVLNIPLLLEPASAIPMLEPRIYEVERHDEQPTSYGERCADRSGLFLSGRIVPVTDCVGQHNACDSSDKDTSRNSRMVPLQTVVNGKTANHKRHTDKDAFDPRIREEPQTHYREKTHCYAC